MLISAPSVIISFCSNEFLRNSAPDYDPKNCRRYNMDQVHGSWAYFMDVLVFVLAEACNER